MNKIFTVFTTFNTITLVGLILNLTQATATPFDAFFTSFVMVVILGSWYLIASEPKQSNENKRG